MTSKQARVVTLYVAGIALAFWTRPTTAGQAPDTNRLAHSNDAIRSRLIVLPRGSGGDSRTIVALGRPATSNKLDDVKLSVQLLLHREVVRQAVLIAARDGLGSSTRDEVIGDRPAEANAGGGAMVVSNFRMEPGASRVFVLRGDGGEKDETLLKHDLLPNSAAEFDYLTRLTTLAEDLSRTALPEALKKLGLKGKPHAYRADKGLPPQVDDRLEHLGFVENLTSVRRPHVWGRWHAATRSLASSPNSIGIRRTRRSRPARSCMPSGWSRANRLRRRASGTGRSSGP
jgi:hypothetical protein